MADHKSERGFFATLLLSLAQDALRLVIAFLIGTGACALVCWYYELPLVLSLVGGFLVLALTVALTTDSLLS